jgi:integrase
VSREVFISRTACFVDSSTASNLRTDPNGRQRHKTFKRREDGKRFLAKVETSKSQGTYLDPSLGKTTLAQFWAIFLPASAELRPATRDVYERVARLHILPHLGNRQLGSLSKLDVQQWVGIIAATAGAATVEKAHTVLRRVLSAAENGGYVSRNAARGVKTPHPSTTAGRFLSSQELLGIAGSVPGRYRALILLMGVCGLRIGEAVALKVDDLDLVHRRLKITKAASEVRGHISVGPTKTGKSRSVHLPRFVAEALASHLAQHPSKDGLLFAASEGGVIRRTNFRRRVWQPAVLSAKIEPPFPRVHDLRHTAASLAIQAGGHPKAVQEMLGHSSIRVTLDRYGHLFPSHKP